MSLVSRCRSQNINGAFKYVFLAAGSSLKGQSDLKKYEKARELKVRHACPPSQPLISSGHSRTSTAFARIIALI